ncbi:ATP12-domain-containing protein [Fistulina hepatica ATCC 64428]|nr:ATP12-domain-containing protein [Fistulina hepatica ATCC 64428]
MSTTSHDGRAVTETNRAEATMKRFWKKSDVEQRGDAYTVTLDKRALKTPSGNTLLLPQNKRLVATLIATEWENQRTLLKPHALPVTSIASRAIDALQDPKIRTEVCNSLLDYFDTDTICFHEDHPTKLVALQDEHWHPLLKWVSEKFNINVRIFGSIIFDSQSQEAKQKLLEVLSGLDHWELAAMERATYTTKSFIIALALVLRHLDVEQAASAAQVEVTSQMQTWGEVEDSHDVDYQDIRRQLGSAACLLTCI